MVAAPESTTDLITSRRKPSVSAGVTFITRPSFQTFIALSRRSEVWGTDVAVLSSPSSLTCDGISLPVVEDHVSRLSVLDHRDAQQATPVHHYSWTGCDSSTLNTKNEKRKLLHFITLLYYWWNDSLVPNTSYKILNNNVTVGKMDWILDYPHSSPANRTQNSSFWGFDIIGPATQVKLRGVYSSDIFVLFGIDQPIIEIMILNEF